jgi:hypothetical protein
VVSNVWRKMMNRFQKNIEMCRIWQQKPEGHKRATTVFNCGNEETFLA